MREERLKRILELMSTWDSVTVAYLAESLDVTEQTIRRDLTRLEETGRVVRTHGGATFPSTDSGDVSYTARLGQADDQKRRIGQVAASLLKPGEDVILDAGTTTLAIARALVGVPHIKVITNALPIAAELVPRPHCDVVLIGGEVRSSTLSTVGPMAREAIAKLHVKKLFLASSAVNPERGFSNTNLAEAEIKQAMIRASDEVYAVADGSKLGRNLFYAFAPIDAVTALITTDDAPAEILQAIRRKGVKVILA